MTVLHSGFDRRAFLKASGVLTVGFSMLGARVADAAIESSATLRPPKSVTNEAIDSWLVISPNNRFAYSADLGLDQIVCYALDAATAKLTPAAQPFVRTPPGSGPRHMTFHPNGKNLYVINELLNARHFIIQWCCFLSIFFKYCIKYCIPPPKLS